MHYFAHYTSHPYTNLNQFPQINVHKSMYTNLNQLLYSFLGSFLLIGVECVCYSRKHSRDEGLKGFPLGIVGHCLYGCV